MAQIENGAILSEPDTRRLAGTLFWLTLPVMAEQSLQFCVSFFDTYLSGRLGANATAAVGVAAYFSWLASMLFGLIGAGSTALVARAWGAGNFQEARQIAARAQGLAILVGLAGFSVLQFLAPRLPLWLGMHGEVYEMARSYLQLDACGQVFAAWTLVAAASLRGAGLMHIPLFVLGITNLVNVVMSILLAFGMGGLPELGVRGIVLGTVIAQATGAGLMAWCVFSPKAKLRIDWKRCGWHGPTVTRILKIGGPYLIDGILTFAGHFLFLMVIARLDPLGFNGNLFAAHVVGIRVEALSYLPAVACGIASASLAGRMLGAENPAAAFRAGQLAAIAAATWGAMMTCIFFLFAEQIFGLMHNEPEVGILGVPAFQLMAWYQVPNAFLIVFVTTLRGAGDTRFPLICALVGTLVVRVPVAYFAGVTLGYGLWGAWLGMGADNLIRSGLIGWRYLSGRWLRTKV